MFLSLISLYVQGFLSNRLDFLVIALTPSDLFMAHDAFYSLVLLNQKLGDWRIGEA